MLDLNKTNISAANSASQFSAGDVLAREAEAVYREGVEKMQRAEALNERQETILAARLGEWKTLVEKAYNDIIARRASWMPWTVCGPSRYNAAKNNARADRQMEAATEWNAKMDRFIENTVSMIRDAIPHDQLIAEYRSGKRRDPISGDDPAAAEKLQARIEGMKERHEAAKQRNAYWRKHGTMNGFPGLSDEAAAKADAAIMSNPPYAQMPFTSYELSCATAEIRRLEARLQTIQRQQEAGNAVQVYNGFTVNLSGTEGRINISFDDKPEATARDVLKKNGFHWSPRAKVWTRQFTGNAERDLRLYVVPGLLALDEYSEKEPPALTLDEFAQRYT